MDQAFQRAEDRVTRWFSEDWEMNKMTSMTQRIKGFLTSPRARGMAQRGRSQMAKPGMQQKLRQFAAQLRRKSAPRR